MLFVQAAQAFMDAHPERNMVKKWVVDKVKEIRHPAGVEASQTPVTGQLLLDPWLTMFVTVGSLHSQLWTTDLVNCQL